jgi:hypothetical protein
MRFHDAYARLTPFELAFPDLDRLDVLVTSVVEEARQLGVDPWNRGAFLLLGSVGALLRDLKPPESGSETFQEYGTMAFHSFHFHRSGRPVVLVTAALVRHLVEEDLPAGNVPGEASHGRVEAPGPSGYIQLPRHLFWVRTAPENRPEPVDGLFWTLSGGEALHLLLVLGLRDDRPGLAVVVVSDAPWEDASHWLRADVRATGKDFETTLPGGELDGLYSIETAGEALKLVARLFHHMTSTPESLTDHDPAGRPDEAVAPSGLPFVRADHRA